MARLWFWSLRQCYLLGLMEECDLRVLTYHTLCYPKIMRRR
jgi:hypothetical protein